jgi:RNA polymerase sigma-70 factor (ECF subfamily)
MGTRETRGEIDDATLKIIRIKAWRLAHSPGFVPDDQEDIEQDLILQLLQRLPKFDSRRGNRPSFINRVLNNAIANLVEHRRAAMRDPGNEAFSLNEPIEFEGGEGAERGETLNPERIDSSARGQRQDLHDLQIDLGRALYGLPSDLRALCALLAEGETRNLKRISEETGIPRGRLYGFVGQIRNWFVRNDLEEYL